MYKYVDRPLSSLDEGCRFLVWSMRAWVTAIGHKRCPAQLLAPAFARWRMIGGLQPFHRAMVLLNRDALDTLAFCPMGCSHVSEHEAVILELITSLRDRGPTATRETLDLVVTEESVGDMLETLSKIGAALAIAGIFPGEPVANPGRSH
ncbi:MULTISPECIES: hypothetical protein [Sphingomonadaceae]|jgi:hypothetical protein|uniref:Uncharacterized protein n=1 Tax=Novosphingobium resinovorum TaxID=158500 RepID=A0A031JWU5_9SPHN|nr:MULTISPECIES: hypothetical protein [Sphingomonadaceae]AOR77019.1 hypothetical protein BES08_09850 [Novosphingobium resinovorum]EJU11551.1 hypothetical protein LH128_18319 [Sphingomonas sp. LH128]EZP81380.1 hypothetical protein BV97_02597 [Novosphingobium resinovorum]MBF7012402.1 hypothetical protein [Novosphingobium sp. HR1a]WJM27143.1 hypothetical protein QUC32_22410 [Novosphingobium resinovorum]